MPTLTRLDSTQADFSDRLTRLLQVDDATDAAIDGTVASILAVRPDLVRVARHLQPKLTLREPVLAVAKGS